MIARLERFADTPMGVFGRLTVGTSWWYTVERPWLDNQPMVSCIPAGVYVMVLDIHNPGQPQAYQVYELQGVPNRKEIQIHRANVADELHGCIAPGKVLGCPLNDQRTWGIGKSADAFAEFMAAMKGENPSEIAITWRAH